MAKYKIGQKVKLIWHPSRVVGEIVRAANRGSWTTDPVEYYIRYDDTNLIPKEDWHKEDELELVDGGKPRVYFETPKCECGVDTVGEGIHSSWCPKGN